MNLFRRRLRTPAESLRQSLLAAAVVVGLELVLHRWMATHDVVAVLFARGGSAGYLPILLALTFVLLRLFAYLLLPGLLARELFQWWMAKRADNEQNRGRVGFQ